MKKSNQKKSKEKGEGGSKEKNKLRKVFLQFVLKS